MLSPGYGIIYAHRIKMESNEAKSQDGDLFSAAAALGECRFGVSSPMKSLTKRPPVAPSRRMRADARRRISPRIRISHTPALFVSPCSTDGLNKRRWTSPQFTTATAPENLEMSCQLSQRRRIRLLHRCQNRQLKRSSSCHPSPPRMNDFQSTL